MKCTKLNGDFEKGRLLMQASRVEGNLNVDSEIGIILPTYCEAANIDRLIRELENSDMSLSILIVDDKSSDGTADIVRKLQKEYRNVLLLVREKKLGLGTAITDGFKAYLSMNHPPNCIVTMDADYSHNPREIPKLVAPVREGCDLVVGSRYCPGGATREWSIGRMVISKVANLITKLRIDAKISDYTSGMRCYSTRLVKGIINDLHSQTYEIQIETIRQANSRGYRISEAPIVFANRKKGKSKLSINEIKDFLSYILSLNRRY
jgi:dolichol-phosphate mannosyltransferase